MKRKYFDRDELSTPLASTDSAVDFKKLLAEFDTASSPSPRAAVVKVEKVKEKKRKKKKQEKPIVVAEPIALKIPNYRTMVCKYFKSDSCVKGDDCPYLHSLESEPCIFFFEKGGCSKTDCKFSHDFGVYLKKK